MILIEFGGKKEMLSKERLRANLDEVIWNIEQARISVSEHHIVKLISVAKYTKEENIKTLYALGQRAFGENQVQQLKKRVMLLEELPLEWHFIGKLQKNKINNLIDLHPSLMQSLDSLELANALNQKLEQKNQTMRCLLQINIDNETNKSGVNKESAVDTFQEIKASYPSLKLQGIMSIGANQEEQKMVQKSFEETYRIYDTLIKDGATICSMGMSKDYELAIKCGSNLVRVGSSLFK